MKSVTFYTPSGEWDIVGSYSVGERDVIRISQGDAFNFVVVTFAGDKRITFSGLPYILTETAEPKE